MSAKRSKNQIGRVLRAAREAKGWTVRKAGEQIGIDHSYYYRIEQGERLPGGDVLPAMARALDLDLEQLRDLTVRPDAMPELGRYLRAKYDLPAEAVEELEAHFREVQGKLKRGRR